MLGSRGVVSLLIQLWADPLEDVDAVVQDLQQTIKQRLDYHGFGDEDAQIVVILR